MIHSPEDLPIKVLGISLMPNFQDLAVEGGCEYRDPLIVQSWVPSLSEHKCLEHLLCIATERLQRVRHHHYLRHWYFSSRLQPSPLFLQKQLHVVIDEVDDPPFVTLLPFTTHSLLGTPIRLS